MLGSNKGAAFKENWHKVRHIGAAQSKAGQRRVKRSKAESWPKNILRIAQTITFLFIRTLVMHTCRQKYSHTYNNSQTFMVSYMSLRDYLRTYIHTNRCHTEEICFTVFTAIIRSFSFFFFSYIFNEF